MCVLFIASRKESVKQSPCVLLSTYGREQKKMIIIRYINIIHYLFKIMQTKNMMIAGGIIFVLIIGYVIMSTESAVKVSPVSVDTTVVAPAAATPNTTAVAGTSIIPADVLSGKTKEFLMTSWMDKIDGKMAAHFSLKEIVVKKGDKVRISITNTAGDHDFKIDAFKVATETPLDKTVVVEFTADKAGDFEFYCSKYNHSKIGQTGTLRVLE